MLCNTFTSSDVGIKSSNWHTKMFSFLSNNVTSGLCLVYTPLPQPKYWDNIGSTVLTSLSIFLSICMCQNFPPKASLSFSECRLLQSLVFLWTAVGVEPWLKTLQKTFWMVSSCMSSEENWQKLTWIIQHNVMDEIYDRINFYKWITNNFDHKVLSETNDQDDGRTVPLSTRPARHCYEIVYQSKTCCRDICFCCC